MTVTAYTVCILGLVKKQPLRLAYCVLDSKTMLRSAGDSANQPYPAQEGWFQVGGQCVEALLCARFHY